jgi:predicted dehydrogenase
MSSFRWGILGTGGIAQAFARDLAYLDDHVVAAVGSRSQTSADTFKSEFPSAVAFGSYEELVTSDVDAIYIASPHPMHEEHAMLALKAGKPVLCEKAFTINAQQAENLITYARENKLALMEAMWTRFLPHIHQIQSIIAAGTLGQIETVIADHGQFIPSERALRLWEPELGGGALLDLGIYPLTLAHLVLGAPTSITAQATLTDKQVDLQTSMILGYSNGAHALLSCTMAVRSSVTAVIAGDKARIEIDGSFYAPTSFRVITRDGEVTEYPRNYEGGGLREEAREFARIVRAGEIESPLMTHATTLELMRQMDEIRRQVGVRYPGE